MTESIIVDILFSIFMVVISLATLFVAVVIIRDILKLILKKRKKKKTSL